MIKESKKAVVDDPHADYKGKRTLDGLPDKRRTEWKEYLASKAPIENEIKSTVKTVVSPVSKVNISSTTHESKGPSASANQSLYEGYNGRLTVNGIPDKRSTDWKEYNAKRNPAASHAA